MREPSRLVLRIQRGDEALQPFGGHRRADLHADRVRDAAKELHVRAVERRRAHADPRHVRRQVVPALLALDVTRLRLLVVHVQPFVAAKKSTAVTSCGARPPITRSKKSSESPMESTIFWYCSHHRRMLHEPEVPVLRMMQVGETAVAQRAHEIQRQRGALVAAQQQRADPARAPPR